MRWHAWNEFESVGIDEDELGIDLDGLAYVSPFVKFSTYRCFDIGSMKTKEISSWGMGRQKI